MKSSAYLLVVLLLSFHCFADNHETCGEALPINEPTLEIQSVVGDNTGNIGGDFGCGEISDGPNYFLTFTATSDYRVAFETVAFDNDDEDTILSVYSGSCESLTCVTSNDDFDFFYLSYVEFDVTSGTTYYIDMSGWFNREGSITMEYAILCSLDEDCNDNIDCTDDICDPGNASSGINGCIFTPNNENCYDSIDCTDDTCNPSTGCDYTPSDDNCDDGFDCTDDSCNPSTGCEFTPNDENCNDSIDCTDDTCNPSTGCEYTPFNSRCNDSIDCTDDSCSTTLGCLYEENNSNCNDNDACTNNACDPFSISSDSNGCVFSPSNVCDDLNECTIDYCYGYIIEETEYTFCISNNIDCDDFDVCTNDYCDEVTGECIHEDIICNDNDINTIDSCDRRLGCQYTINICSDEDDDVCTTPTLNLENGNCEKGDTIICDDGNPCTEDYCDSMRGCQITWKDCDDELRCTNDYCNQSTGECVHEQKDCSSTNPGTICSEDLFGECVENSSY